VLLSHIEVYKDNLNALMSSSPNEAFEALCNDLEAAEFWFARFLADNGQLDEAQVIIKRIGVWREKHFGLDGERTLESLHNLPVSFRNRANTNSQKN
jgi:hypothetical protein